MEITIETIFWILSGFVIFNFCAAYLIFAQKTMHPIEKKIRDAGGKLPQWDGVGFRIGSYATALIVPIKAESLQLVDERSLRKFATKADRLRAWYFWGSLALFLIFAIIFVIFFDQ